MICERCGLGNGIHMNQCPQNARQPDAGAVANGLRKITARLIKTGRAKGGFFGLAGEYGYGADFENEVFSMHYDRYSPECDCGGSKPKHKSDCDTITKRQAWIDERNAVGMVPANGMPDGWMTTTPTTLDEQDAWMHANPFPKCSCGEEAAWLKRNKLKRVPSDGVSFFDRVGSTARRFKHTDACELTVYAKPHFLHKSSGSTVHWYKSIGRDMTLDLKAPWTRIERACLRSLRVARG